jgi:hypothetical protein
VPPGFSRLLGIIKSWFKGSPWILCALNVMAVIILAGSNHNYPSVAPTSQGGFWSHGAQEFYFPILTNILDQSDQ